MEALLDNDNSIKQLKQQRTIFIGTTFLFLISTIIFIITTFIGFKAQWSSIPSESIIPVVKESSVEGKIDADSAAYYNRSADVKNSKYYPILNFYDGTVTSTLKILPKFKTYQQSSPISCGDASALMALRYFGIDTITEYDLYKEAKTMPGHGTNTENLGKALQKLVGDKFTVTYKKDDTIIKQDEFQTMVKDCTEPSNNKVMLLESVEWVRRILRMMCWYLRIRMIQRIIIRMGITLCLLRDIFRLGSIGGYYQKDIECVNMF